MRYHLIAFVIGCILDLILGDPHFLYHPIRIIGNLIGTLERNWNKKEFSNSKKLKLGKVMVIVVIAATLAVTMGLLIVAYVLHPYLGVVVESIMSYQILAMKCLKVESMKVYDRLTNGTLEEARYAVSMIVGRDTKVLDETGVAKAAIETVAENTSDGVIAPMIYMAIGGPVLGFIYKAINTMDSMVGYKNDKYLYYGRAAAKLDDIANYLPARISGWLMIFAAGVLSVSGRGHGTYSAKRARKIYLRDRYNHASPNSAQTEAACAGALGIQLAGDASYFGKVVSKPFIGDYDRKVEFEDIKRANKLMYATAFICGGICILIMVSLLVSVA